MPRPTKQKAPKGSRVSTQSDVTITDPRFSNIHTDPRYRLPTKKHTHVKLDKRFAHMLRDDDFSKKATVDRYGRKLPKGAGKKELQRFYRVDDNDNEEGVDGDAQRLDDDDDVREELERVERSYDPARQGGFSSSSEESSLDEEDEIVGEEDEEGPANFPDVQVDQQTDVPMGEVSSRLAVVNLDWDNIRATDLMAVFSSFTPSHGRILKVSVYPSEFGKERMEREEVEGPPPEIFAQSTQGHKGAELNRQQQDDEDDKDDDEGEQDEDEDEDEEIKKEILAEDKGDEFDSAALRHYQLERLRYYYAVLTCSSPAISKALYDATDGTEYLTTANFFDLRFIPDDVTFEDDKPRDECESIPDGYRPNEFVTDALQHSKVRLTWDADDVVRKEAQKRAFTGSRAELDENDLRAYLGSDSSDDDEPSASGPIVAGEQPEPRLSKKEAERQRMRSLLGLSDNAVSLSSSKREPGAPVGDMQITFAPGLSSNTKQSSVFENEPEKEETTVEKYVRKEKERKARRKQKTKAGGSAEAFETDGAEADPEQLGGVEGGQKRNGDLGFDDPFFTAPGDDKATASALRKEERRKKREQRAADEAATASKRAELELLMVDDQRADVAHFDMNEIQRAEKRAKKKGKKAKKDKGANLQAEQEGFQMDVQDPRFSQVFESHEFAIDPTNPRFKGTEGMKALLEEGRRKRRRDDPGAERSGIDSLVEERKEKKAKSMLGEGEIANGSEDLEKLVQRVKGKTKRKPK
ncbi:MAG: pre-rRNA-processing protein esf1 [Candelina submexicana]|nr:MAG: pre-rRNA-processing protein esf1 [Candelina submexicana]